MTLVLDISPEKEALLREAAARSGLSVEEYAKQKLTGDSPTQKSSRQSLLQEWIEEDKKALEAMTAAERAEAYQEWETFNQSLHENPITFHAVTEQQD